MVKTFGQTVFSFKLFKASIDNYEKWVIAYTKQLRLPMMFYTTAINGVFAFLIAGGALLTRNGVTSEMLLNLIFYIVITPVIGTTLTKIMFMSEDSMIVSDAISRIDRVLGKRPLQKRPLRRCRPGIPLQWNMSATAMTGQRTHCMMFRCPSGRDRQWRWSGNPVVEKPPLQTL